MSSRSITPLIPKIYKCDLETLDLDRQTLTMENYQLLTTSVRFLTLYLCEIKNSDGTTATMDQLLANLYKVEAFQG